MLQPHVSLHVVLPREQLVTFRALIVLRPVDRSVMPAISDGLLANVTLIERRIFGDLREYLAIIFRAQRVIIVGGVIAFGLRQIVVTIQEMGGRVLRRLRLVFLFDDDRLRRHVRDVDGGCRLRRLGSVHVDVVW